MRAELFGVINVITRNSPIVIINGQTPLSHPLIRPISGVYIRGNICVTWSNNVACISLHFVK